MTDSPVELVGLAAAVIEQAPRSVGADRTIAAALLVRQALESAVDAWWGTCVPSMSGATQRDKLVSLPFYLDKSAVDVGDPGLSGDIRWAWSRLSEICHRRGFASPPAVVEIRNLAAVVTRLDAVVSGSAG